jgi:hypothetical protein
MSIGLPYSVFERRGHRFASRKRVKKNLEPGSDSIRTEKGLWRFPDLIGRFLPRFCAGPDIQEAFSAFRIGSEISLPVPET